MEELGEAARPLFGIKLFDKLSDIRYNTRWVIKKKGVAVQEIHGVADVELHGVVDAELHGVADREEHSVDVQKNKRGPTSMCKLTAAARWGKKRILIMMTWGAHYTMQMERSIEYQGRKSHGNGTAHLASYFLSVGVSCCQSLVADGGNKVSLFEVVGSSGCGTTREKEKVGGGWQWALGQRVEKLGLVAQERREGWRIQLGQGEELKPLVADDRLAPRKLRLELVLEGDGEKYVGLYLSHVDAVSKNSVIKAIYKLFVYDQLHAEDIQKEGEDYFHSTSHDGFCCKIALDKFNSSKSGLLVNDCCIFGAEVLEAFSCKLDKEGLIHESLSLKKDLTPRIYTWVIKDVSKLTKILFAEVFAAGGYNWRICLYPNLPSFEDFLSVFLIMTNAASLSSKTRVYVDFSFCLLDQHNAKHWKLTVKHLFSSKNRYYGCRNFLSRDDVRDPSRDKEGIHESLSLKKDLTARIYTWVIKDVSKSKDRLLSETVAAGGYNWRISLYPNLASFKDFFAIFLMMDHGANLGSKTRVYVDYSFCLLDQHNAKHWNVQVLTICLR
ncbi:hypothetical protein ZIOFF_045525 [Zingiber officinale]|uniref:MATH domain-containing protein n=1 Tax=Zingiber officinale TaxID=94328 RepID=A0A8J5L183_ZINOF|nr:hypothetical protein ZIOFF_045525 [Zingiber officinale]